MGGLETNFLNLEQSADRLTRDLKRLHLLRVLLVDYLVIAVFLNCPCLLAS